MVAWIRNPFLVIFLIFTRLCSGDYPEEIKTRVLRKTHDTGFRKSRLPTLTDEEINFIRGTFDFVGLNSYTTRIVEHRECHVNEEETRK